jgi:hypothetical protein
MSRVVLIHQMLSHQTSLIHFVPRAGPAGLPANRGGYLLAAFDKMFMGDNSKSSL